MVYADRPMQRRGFSLIDTMMAVVILAIVVAVALPALNNNDRLRIRAAAAILTSDIEFAQSMTIAYPNDPVVLVFTPSTQTYYLAHESDTSTPLTRPDTGEVYVVTLGDGRARVAAGVEFQLGGMPDNQMTFDPVGGLKSHTSSPRIRLLTSTDPGSPSVFVVIDSMTGTITESWSDIGSSQ